MQRKQVRRPTPAPKTKRVRVTEYEEPGEGETPDDISDDFGVDPDEESIRSILGQFGGRGEVEVKVYRMTPSGKEYCYTDGPDVTEESIKQGPYGANGGKFLLHVMIDGQLRRAFPVSIAAPIRSGAGDSGSDALVRAIERLEARFANPQNTQSEPMSAVLNAAVNLINSQQNKPVETPLDQVMNLAKMMIEIRGGPSEDDSFAGILKGIAREVAPVILPGLMAGRGGAVQGQTMSDEQQTLIQGIAYLKRKCMMNADPALYLELILDNADDERFKKLVQLAASNTFEVFTRIDPELANPPFRAYFEFIYNGLRSAFDAANQVDMDSSGAGGDTANTKPNGGARKGGAG